ncbi:MAG: SGNH/GDSL hydrolase family protein [Propionibacteriales bacterium]|nr:SGNH/GDSL hydrolase family protein [Propionibacteriales bacterium]
MLGIAAYDPAGAGPERVGVQWVGSWAVAVTAPSPGGLSARGVDNATLRQVVHLSVGGDAVRVRLSNAFGARPLRVGAVTLAPPDGGPVGTPTIDAERAVPVTFGGRSTVTIAPGAERLSDAVGLPMLADSDLVVSIYFPTATGPLTQHALGSATGFVAAGDATRSPGGVYRRYGTARLALSAIDVQRDVQSEVGSVAFFGDSITDGFGSTLDANGRYTDVLTDRMLALPEDDQFGVLNVGISGNRLLSHRYAAGMSGLSRFDRDLLARSGVHTVVLLEGVNDINGAGGSLRPRDLVRGYLDFIARAHESGIRVVGATLTPYEGWSSFSRATEADRRAVNRWIRRSGAFDAVVDLDAAVRDPSRPTRLLPRFDSGDHLHPSDAGYAAMAAAFDLADLQPTP